MTKALINIKKKNHDLDLDRPKSLYFAYGSNLNMSRMKERCPESHAFSLARVNYMRFIINDLGVATIVNDFTGTVFGALWEISAVDEENLDHYEGVKYGLYEKRFFEAICLNGNSFEALVYIATNDKSGRPRKNYLNTILTGINDFGGHSSWKEEVEAWRFGPVRSPA